MKTRALLLLLVMCGVCGHWHAESQNITNSDTLLLSARRGNPLSQRQVGIACFQRREFEFAIRWLEKSLAQRDSIAPYYLGLIYRNGYRNIFEEQDHGSLHTRALRYFQLSADMGYPQAQYMTGVYYLNGMGVFPDKNEGLRYLGMAAENGMPRALDYMERYAQAEQRALLSRGQEKVSLISDSSDPQTYFQLGYVYYKGINVVADTATALMYMERAADQGVKEAAYYAAVIRMDTLDYIPQDNSLTVKYLSMAAEGDIPEAQYLLGYSLLKGEIVPQDMRMSAYWFLRAAVNEYAPAQANIGYLYYKGMGVEKDMEKALDWLGRAASKKVPAAMYTLGVIYLYGDGVDKDPIKAFDNISAAARERYPVAMYAMGLLYEQGEVVPADDEKSQLWYQRASEAGYLRADKHLEVDID